MAISRDARRFYDRFVDRALKKKEGLMCVGIRLGTIIEPFLTNPEAVAVKGYIDHKCDDKDLCEFRITEDVMRTFVLCNLLANHCSSDPVTARTISITTAIAMSQHGYIPTVDACAAAVPRQPFEEIWCGCIDELREYAIGHTYREIVKSLEGIPEDERTYWLSYSRQLGVDNIVLTKELLHDMVTLFYWQAAQSELPALTTHTATLFVSTASLTALLACKLKSVNSELSEAKRKRSQRKPTKKQSEVITDLKKQVAELQDKLEKDAATSDSVLRAATLNMERENSSLKKKLEKAEQENALLKENLEDAEAAMELQEKVEEAGELPPLPEEGVLFVGGHPRMIKYLSAIHPRWTYVQPDEAKATDFGSPAVAFIFAWHMGHSAEARVRRDVGADKTIVLRLNSNIERLERTMQYLYATRILKEGG